MENNEPQEKTDTRTFSDKWLENIFQVLMRLEDYERLSKNGCVTIMDYVQNTNLDLAVVQEKNYDLFMTEVEIVLNDTKPFIDKKTYLSLFLTFKNIKSKEIEVDGFLAVHRDEVRGLQENYLKKEFYYILPLLTDLRGKLVVALLGFINPKLNLAKDKVL